MTNALRANLEMIKFVAEKLGDLREQVAFLGGATTGLLITDPATPNIRPTEDVDIITEITSRSKYYQLEEFLRNLGFRQNPDEENPICRWVIDHVIVDVMPTDEEILGFSNQWYSPAIINADRVELEDNLVINVVTAPYFLATKIEAFEGRGQGDFLRSHDIEDIIAVIDGRKEIVGEIKKSPEDLKTFLAIKFKEMIDNELFTESISGHLLPDSASQARAPLIINRIEEIIVSGEK